MPEEYVFTGASMNGSSSANADDLVETSRDLALGQAQHHPVDEHVLATGDLGVEAGAELDERGHAPGHAHDTGGRLADARDQLQHRALAGAVSADDAERPAGSHVERHAVERLEHFIGSHLTEDATREQRALQGAEMFSPAVPAIHLVHVADFDGVHTSSANVSRSRSNTTSQAPAP
jgi:hypothetical protein